MDFYSRRHLCTPDAVCYLCYLVNDNILMGGSITNIPLVILKNTSIILQYFTFHSKILHQAQFRECTNRIISIVLEGESIILKDTTLIRKILLFILESCIKLTFEIVQIYCNPHAHCSDQTGRYKHHFVEFHFSF